MITSKQRFYHFCKLSSPYLLLILLVALFFWKIIFQSKVLLPGDIVTGVYFPWLDYKWGYIVGVPVKNPITSDVVSFTFPMQTYAISLLKAGKLPLWNPYILTGIPLMANFQSAPFAVTNIYYWLFETITAWNFKIISSHLLAAIFMYFLLRDWKISKEASITGSILYAFSGFNLIWSQWNAHTLVAAFIPLLILLTKKVFCSRSLFWTALFAISFGFQIYAGYPQVVIYTVMAIGLFWVLWSVSDHNSDQKSKVIGTVLLLVGGLLGVGFAALQIFPAAELLNTSQREVEPLSADLAFLPIDKLITFIAPDYFGNHTTYNFWHTQDYTSNTGFIGVVALTLGFIGLSAPYGLQKRYFVILALLAIVLSFNTPISHLLWRSGVIGFQAASAHRALILWCFSASALAALGYDLLQRGKTKLITLVLALVPAITIFVIFASLLLWHPPYMSHTTVALRNMIFPLLILCSLIMLLLIHKLNRKVILVLVSAVLIIEVFRFGWKFTPIVDRSLVYPTTPTIDYLLNQEQPFRVTADDVIPINFLMTYGVQTIEGYDAIYPRYISMFLSVLNSEDVDNSVGMGRYGQVDNQNGPLLDLVNAKYYVALKRDKDDKPSESGDYIKDYQAEKFVTVFSDKSTSVLESTKALPRAFMVYEWENAKSDTDALKRLIDPSFNFANKIAFSSAPLYDPQENSTQKNSVVFNRYQSELVSLTVSTDAPGYLFMSDAWYPGWKVYIDAGEAVIERANYAFRAVHVPQGAHIVEFKYEPSSAITGLKVTAISICGIILILLVHLRSQHFRKRIDYMTTKTHINTSSADAAKLHENVPPDWYHDSIQKNIGQRFWHNTRFTEVAKLMEPVAEKVLDIGSADGVFSQVILEKTDASSVIGIDVLKTSVNWANKHWKAEKRLSFKVGNAHKLDFRGNSFDAVFALEVMEHVSEPDKVLKEIYRVLKNGGYAVLLVPSDNKLFQIVWFIWTKFMRGRIWDDCHVQSFNSGNSLAKHGKRAGFKVEKDHYFLLGMLNAVKLRKK